MAKQLQFRRGTTAENDAFKGAPGELTYDIERKELRVHDGVTLGGKPIEPSANLAHTIGNETINGTKTFTSAIGRKSSKKYSETDTSVSGTNFADTIIATSDSENKTLSVIYTQRIVDNKHTQTLYRTFNPITNKYIDIQGRIKDDNTHSVHVSGSAGTNECLSKTTNSTSENTIACQGWVNNPNASTNVVHRTGNETIGGSKKFTSAIQIGAISANDSYEEVRFADDSGQRVGVLRATNGASGGRRIEMFSAKADGTRGSGIAVSIDADGNEYHTAKTPDATSNTNHIATTAWVNTAAVHKTGDEAISGVKTFSYPPVTGNNGYRTKANYSKGGTASSTQYFWTNTVFDKDGVAQSNKLSQIFTQVDTSGALKLTMAAFKNVSGDTLSTNLSIGFDANGNVTTYAPTPATSSNTTNIATTAFVKSVLSGNDVGLAKFSQGGNGYYKFSNGLIIQWGQSSGTEVPRTITMPTAFTGARTFKAFVQPLVAGATANFYQPGVDDTSQTTTTFKVYSSGNVSGTGWHWFAIGY